MLLPAKYVVWLTGLPESGKTTIGSALCRILPAAYLIDGDQVRSGLCKDCDFSPAGRTENIRRVTYMAIALAEAGIVPVVALVSPNSGDRLLARTRIESAKLKFIEVYISTPQIVCEERDSKGHYRQARLGQIKNFTGVNAPYDVPVVPDVIIDTSKKDSPFDDERKILHYIHCKL